MLEIKYNDKYLIWLLVTKICIVVLCLSINYSTFISPTQIELMFTSKENVIYQTKIYSWYVITETLFYNQIYRHIVCMAASLKQAFSHILESRGFVIRLTFLNGSMNNRNVIVPTIVYILLQFTGLRIYKLGECY